MRNRLGDFEPSHLAEYLVDRVSIGVPPSCKSSRVAVLRLRVAPPSAQCVLNA